MASTSSETPSLPGWKFDVFLSFRGEDTRHGFTDHLYAAFISKGIEAFRDNEKLQLGQEIASELIQAIENSQCAIVVFSEKYADSRWCLDELAEIVECKKNKGLKEVVPVFYHVDPSDVRKQTGPFKKAFDEHQKNDRIDREKIQKWKDAMREVGDLAGEHLPPQPHQRSEAECIQDIVEVILNKLDNTFSAHTFSKLIGMESRVEKLKSHLAMESNDVRIIGIWGTGGTGKTTLARVVYDMVPNHFEARCFIANVREESKKCGLCELQKNLLKNLLMLRNLNFQDVNDGVQMIKNRLHNKKILLVLDDVNELDQLEKLAGEHCWFGSGSRIMITTRDRHLLEHHDVTKIYEAEELNHDEALKLFSLKAFKMDHPIEDYGKLSQAFVDYCKGLPLALEVLGSLLFKKSIDEWKSELGRLTEFGERRILDVLRISFDGLQPIHKEIFLNIACFFNHMNQDDVKKILDCLGLYPTIGLRVLIDKSLIKLVKNQLWMHDLLQEMGRYIACQESQDPGERSRLWLFKDINNVLTENTGTKQIQCIVLEKHEPEDVDWNPEAFSKMRNLKLLKIGGVQLKRDLKHLPTSLRILDWRGYPSKSLTLSSQSKNFENLKFMNLSGSPKLIEVPDITEVPNLESLVLSDCINLRRIHPSIGIHKKLTILNLYGCEKLTSLPSKFEMECLTELILYRCSKITKIPPSIGSHKKLTILWLRECKNLTSLPSKFEMECLTQLDLGGCSKITKIPEFGRNMKRVRMLDLSGTAITTLPTSIKHLTDLKSLVLRSCINLRRIHPSIGIHKKLTILDIGGCENLTSLPSKFEIKFLRELNLTGCSKLTEIPEFGRNMKRVQRLYVSDTPITTLPTSIEHLTALDELRLYRCINLVHLPDTIFNLKLVRKVVLQFCPKLDRLPENLGNAESLKELELRETAIREVPSSIGLLKHLHRLILTGCKGLSSNKSRYELLPFYSLPTSPHPIDLLFSSLSLSPASSLTELTLSDCNLKAISNDIFCSLFSLEKLSLSGNDFVCLPESIIRLSKLKSLGLNNCTSLRSLPKLPLNIEDVGAAGCISLEMLPGPLKPSDSVEPIICLQNCFQLADNQSCIDWFISGIRKYVMLCPSLPPEFLEKSSNIAIPGSEIPEWFSHQSMGNELEIKQPSHLYNEWMGTAAICILFCARVDFPPSFLKYSLIGNGKSMPICSFEFALEEVSPDHLLLVHLTPQSFNEESHKLMWAGDVNGFSQFRIKMEIQNIWYDSWVKVKKWGFRMIYKKDMDRTMVQYSNSSITPYDGMDVLHHNFDNSSVAVEGSSDYNMAGPSGEGSSDYNMAGPSGEGSSDCEESSEYKGCDEELSDWEEPSESDRDCKSTFFSCCFGS